MELKNVCVTINENNYLVLKFEVFSEIKGRVAIGENQITEIIRFDKIRIHLKLLKEIELNEVRSIQYFVLFKKLNPNDKKLTHYRLKIDEKGCTSKYIYVKDDATWFPIYKTAVRQNNFELSIDMDAIPCCNHFATIYDDTELTDFELRGEDGSVHIHRAMLAASSPVLKQMLCGTWRETTEGHVEVPGTSKTTLQHLKDYIYLRTLPETGLEQLLLLASYYMMPELEQKCAYKLAYTVTAQNACELLEFATKNKVCKLTLAILECVQKGVVTVI